MEHKIIFILKGLDCANCANKIETIIGKTSGVTESVVVFVREELRITYDNSLTKEDIINLVKKEVGRIEPDVEVTVFGDLPKIITPSVLDKEKDEFNTKKININTYFDLVKNNRILVFCFGVVIFLMALMNSSEFKPIIFIIAYIILGGDVVARAIKNILRGDFFDENFLMSIATIGAFFIGEYPEAVAVMIFYQIGEYLSDLAVEKSRKSIKSLMDIQPEFANIELDGILTQVSPNDVKVGDVIVVKPGEKIPLDGVITEGRSQIDASSLIGESVPRVVNESDNVLSGSINLTGLIKVLVTSDYKNSTVAKILDLVENASAKKSPTEQFITKFSKIYTPLVVLAALLLSIVPPLITGDSFSLWINRGLIFLVISCPCALVISVPLTFFSGIGTASKKGILIKGGNYLQLLSAIDTVVFDKTGTLTKGVFEVSEIIFSDSSSKNEVLKYAYILENYSNHPIAKSITNEYSKLNDSTKYTATNVNDISGMGLAGTVNNEIILVGNKKLMYKENIDFKEYDGFGTLVYVAKNNTFLGVIVISDKLKDDAKKSIELLKKNGINNIIMLTGDSEKVAQQIALSVGIDKVYSELLPNNKMEKLEDIYNQNPNRKVIFVGDGINDAPVLTLADVGIAMGGVGSAAAIEAADVVIMNDELTKVVDAIEIGKNTVTIAKQNIIFALGIKAIFLVLGTMGIASMWMAVFADVGVTLLAVLNSIRKK